MSETTREINRITGTIIGISVRLIIGALLLLLLYEGMTRGYEFGHEIFCSTAVAVAPGTDKGVRIEEGTSAFRAAEQLRDLGLIKNEYAFVIQSKFYDYEITPGTYTLNTSMTAKEILQVLDENKDTETGDTATEETTS